jgi:hypothetical protein
MDGIQVGEEEKPSLAITPFRQPVVSNRPLRERAHLPTSGRAAVGDESTEHVHVRLVSRRGFELDEKAQQIEDGGKAFPEIGD